MDSALLTGLAHKAPPHVVAPADPLSPDELHRMDAYWRAANYLSVGQIYLRDNALLERPLTIADGKIMVPDVPGVGTEPDLEKLAAHRDR